MPNLFAYAMLLIWPLIMMGLFKSLTPDRALIWSFLGAFMVLPSGAEIDLPLIPSLDKFTIPSLAALVICMTMLKQKIRLFPASMAASVLMIGFVLSPLATFLDNRAPLIYAEVFIPGMSIRDAISEALSNTIILIPFVLAFNLLSTHQARFNFLTAYMIAGLIYSIPMLLEVRLSPQIGNWVYGFYSFGEERFLQQMRLGGFRPVVFMGHGLSTAFFGLMTVLSTAILWRASNDKNRTLYAFAAIYLLFVLVMCKTAGVLVFAVLFLPVIVFASRTLKGWAILVCTLFVLSYPVLRAADAVPTDAMVSYAAMVQEERAQSLEFRFDNEEVLLNHASNKPLFGWGSWGRNLVYDATTGENITITDGYWIIIIGILGWTGYISVFGLLTLPLLRLWSRRRQPAADENNLIYGTSLMLAVNLLELLPNTSINTITWLLAGLLLASSLQTGTAQNDVPTPEGKTTNKRMRPQYTRQPPEQRPYARPALSQAEREQRRADRIRR
ncbi:hypothetical protein [Yoonia algicola]|uniref:O-antigen ligase domain-containing protein n=1 Tax=Yoonia algicola TaxID=3137368 RepID=A0AAN0NEG1_9RHOB